jgi:hypothetical protein
MVGGLNVHVVTVKAMSVSGVSRDCARRKIFSEFGVGGVEFLQPISHCSMRVILAAAAGYRFGRVASLVYRRCGSVSPSASVLVAPSLATSSNGDCGKR